MSQPISIIPAEETGFQILREGVVIAALTTSAELGNWVENYARSIEDNKRPNLQTQVPSHAHQQTLQAKETEENRMSKVGDSSTITMTISSANAEPSDFPRFAKRIASLVGK
jgi:hypothetical protein